MNNNNNNNDVIGSCIVCFVVSASIVWLKYKKEQLTKKASESPFAAAAAAAAAANNLNNTNTNNINNIPIAPNGHWLFGHVLKLQSFDGFQQTFKSNACPTTGLCSLWLVNKPAISVLRGNDAQVVLKASVTKGTATFVSNHINHFLGESSIIRLNGREWKLYRSAILKSFAPKAIQESQSSIIKVGQTLTKSLLQEIVNDSTNSNSNGDNKLLLLRRTIHPLMKMATFDVFGLAVLGVDFECCQRLHIHEIATSFEFLEKEFQRRMNTPLDISASYYNIPTKANIEYAKHRNIVRDYVANLIEQTEQRIIIKEEEEEQGHHRDDDTATKKHDLLTNIVKAATTTQQQVTATATSNNDDDSTTTPSTATAKSICDNTITLLFAGYDTTSIALTYALYLLAKNQTIQQICYDEINMVLGNNNSNHDYAASKIITGPDVLPYTSAVIMESLRLYPPAIAVTRTLEKDITLHENINIPKSTTIFLPIWCIQRDESNFSKPLEFRPDRWVRRKQKRQSQKQRQRYNSNGSGSGIGEDGDGGDTSSSLWEERPMDDNDLTTDASSNDDNMIPPGDKDSFLAFSAGARNCAGKNFAIREAVTLLGLLLHELKFDLITPDYEVIPKLKLLQSPHDELPMILTKRK